MTGAPPTACDTLPAPAGPVAAARPGDTTRDRSRGALLGLALGDALGMPSQTLTPAEIARHYGTITGFVAPFDGHPVSHGLAAGQITDDTEQTLLLARRLALPGPFDPAGWAHDLIGWEADVRRRGLRDLLGPSSKAALVALLAGASPDETGRGGTTNGAAMRIAPVGILCPPDAGLLVDKVAQTCRVTHNTGEAIAAAAAVAMVVSLGVAGHTFEETLDAALDAARRGQFRGHPSGVTDMADRIARALDLAQAPGTTPQTIAARVGTSVASHASVPAAFALLRMTGGDTWAALCLAANIGDDTDTIGAMAGAMGGACAGLGRLPADRIAELRAANTADIDGPAVALAALRRAAPGQGPGGPAARVPAPADPRAGGAAHGKPDAREPDARQTGAREPGAGIPDQGMPDRGAPRA